MSTNAKPSFRFGDLKTASGLDQTVTRKLDLLGGARLRQPRGGSAPTASASD